MKKHSLGKSNKKVSYSSAKKNKLIAEEPVTSYQSNFTFNRFRKIYDMAPFTFKEWANFLHLSERTLLRYSKENKPFEGIYVERILMLERLFHKGDEVFADAGTFYAWLRKPKKILSRTLDESALTTTEGILALDDELGRIEQGVYI